MQETIKKRRGALLPLTGEKSGYDQAKKTSSSSASSEDGFEKQEDALKPQETPSEIKEIVKKRRGALLPLLGGKSGDDQPQQTSSSSTPSEDGIEKQEDALKPRETPDEKQSFGAKVLAFIGKVSKSEAWAREWWSKAEAEANPGTIDALMRGELSSLFEAFCEQELSSENYEAFHALEFKTMSNKLFYETFCREDSPKQVNLDEKVLVDLQRLATEGRYDEMDFTEMVKAVRINLNDTYARFKVNKGVLTEIFKKLTGVTPPKTVAS